MEQLTEKRFTSYKNNERIVGFKDNVTGKHHSSFLEAIWILNDTWEQTQRFEKYSQEYLEERNKLQEENEYYKRRLKEVLKELYCKDRVLEEKGISVECCDKNE